MILLLLLFHQFFVSITHVHIKEEEQLLEISSTYTGHDIELWFMDHNALHGNLELVLEDSSTFNKVSKLIPKDIVISNDILFSTFKQQQNKINFQRGTKIESGAITAPGQAIKFEL